LKHTIFSLYNDHCIVRLENSESQTTQVLTLQQMQLYIRPNRYFSLMEVGNNVT